MNADFSKVKTINMAIFQPRLKTIPSSPEWSCSRTDLAIFAEDMKVCVRRVAEAKKNSVLNETYANAVKWAEEYLNPSEKACQWCRAKAKCPAIAKQCLEYAGIPSDADDYGLCAIDDEERSLDEDIINAIASVPGLPFKTLAKIYGAKGLISDWMKAVEDRMLKEMLAGEKHRDWKLVKGQGGNRKWKDAGEVEAMMKSMKLKVDEMYDKEIISPTNAEKLLKKRPRLWAKLKPLIGRSEGVVKVAPMSSKQPSVDPYNEDIAGLDHFSIDDYTTEFSDDYA